MGQNLVAHPVFNFDLQSTLKINTFFLSKQGLSLALKVLNNSVYVSVLKSLLACHLA